MHHQVSRSKHSSTTQSCLRVSDWNYLKYFALDCQHTELVGHGHRWIFTGPSMTKSAISPSKVCILGLLVYIYHTGSARRINGHNVSHHAYLRTTHRSSHHSSIAIRHTACRYGPARHIPALWGTPVVMCLPDNCGAHVNRGVSGSPCV